MFGEGKGRDGDGDGDGEGGGGGGVKEKEEVCKSPDIRYILMFCSQVNSTRE